MDKARYYVVTKRALPEVLLKVVQVKRLLMTEKKMTIQEAAASLLHNILLYP